MGCCLGAWDAWDTREEHLGIAQDLCGQPHTISRTIENNNEKMSRKKITALLLIPPS